MQEVFEKIIEKLEEKIKEYDERIERRNCACYFDETDKIRKLDDTANGIEQAIEIVKQEAEQYEECYKYCGDCEAYEKEKHYCPKFCNVIKETVKEIEANHNGWIPCSGCIDCKHKECENYGKV